MTRETALLFASFRLEPDNARLWHGAHALKLKPKAFAVLRYLVAHADQLVSKDELWRAVWPDVTVSDDVLTACVRDIRKTLGDNAKTPQFIETVRRRGYRFIAPLSTAPPVQGSTFKVQGFQSAIRIPQSAIALVGRESELAQMHGWLDKALDGERQIVFVTGEPGIGKTTLIEAFLFGVRSHEEFGVQNSEPRTLNAELPSTPNLWLGQGQCIEHYGAGEAYLPVLDALGRLCREPGGERLIELLSQQAPTWLAQMPALLNAADLEALQRKTQGATKERMLREIAEALEVVTAERPLMLVLEDLHWSDPSTLDLLAFVARRSHPTRLLILGNYRPVEMLSDGHPLKRVTQELYAHQLGTELALRRLNETEVSAYLTLRFPESVLPTRLGQVLQQRTGGNPLFLTSLVQDLLQRRVILQEDDGRWEWHGDIAELETWTPESVRQLLARQRERLGPEEQRVLAAASLAGLEFSAAAVAAALETEAIEVEEHCGRLAEQQHFLRLAGIGEWPDGTRAGRYGFLHALYQEFWHERVSVGKQQQWHRRMGERKEAAYGQRAGEIATELALHFEQGREYRKAVQYLQQAGQNATQRSAYVEAISHLTRGLELLKTLPDTPERTQQELLLQVPLGAPLMAMKGYAALEVEKTYNRALALCRQAGETPQLFPVLWGLWAFYHIRGELQTAREVAEQFLRLAQSVQDPALLLEAHYMLGETLYFLGELVPARAHLEQEVVLYDPQKHHHVQDPGVGCLFDAALDLWALGYPDQALKRGHEALTLAREMSHPFSLALALAFAAGLHWRYGEVQAVQERAEALIALSTEQGFSYRAAQGTIYRGWVLSEQGQGEEGIAQIHKGLAAWRATGAGIAVPFYLALLAGAYGKVGQTEEGLTELAEALALVDKTGERVFEAELYRLKGTLTLQSKVESGKSKEEEAEACFLKAIEVARHQQAKSLELRAATSLARLWQQQGKQHEARNTLSEIYHWFTEGFGTKDLQEAKALLEGLNH